MEELRPKENLHKHPEATAYMVGIIDDEGWSDAEKHTVLKKTLKRIQEQDIARDDTRAWAHLTATALQTTTASHSAVEVSVELPNGTESTSTSG